MQKKFGNQGIHFSATHQVKVLIVNFFQLINAQQHPQVPRSTYLLEGLIAPCHFYQRISRGLIALLAVLNLVAQYSCGEWGNVSYDSTLKTNNHITYYLSVTPILVAKHNFRHVFKCTVIFYLLTSWNLNFSQVYSIPAGNIYLSPKPWNFGWETWCFNIYCWCAG